MAGWMGLSDIDYTNPTVEEGRQHAFLSLERLLRTRR